MFQAVSEVGESQCVVERHAGDSVEQARDIGEVELLPVPRVDAQQPQIALFLDQLVPQQGSGQFERDIMSLLIGEHILNAPLLHLHAVLHYLIHLDLPQKLALGILMQKEIEAKLLQARDARRGSEGQFVDG